MVQVVPPFAREVNFRISRLAMLNGQRPDRGLAGVDELNADDPKVVAAFGLGFDGFGADLKLSAQGQRKKKNRQHGCEAR